MQHLTRALAREERLYRIKHQPRAIRYIRPARKANRNYGMDMVVLGLIVCFVYFLAVSVNL